MPAKGIIILEGADSAGKTTLARALLKDGGHYIHGAVYKDPWRWHVAALRRAARLSQDGLVVIDRNWISHLVYQGEVFGGAQYTGAGARCLDRMFRRYAALTILCSPENQEAQASDWARDKASGKPEKFDRVKEVIAFYADLRWGNLARPGETYLNQLTRFGDYAERDDVLVYDRFRWLGAKVKFFVERARQYLHLLQTMRLQGHRIAGRSDARQPATLIVMNRGSGCWPAFDRETSASPETRLNTALHQLAVDETKITITDSVDGLVDLLYLGKWQRIITLGNDARALINSFNLGNSLSRNHFHAPHPKWHLKAYPHDLKGYADYLRPVLL
jgi:hypothetical protein